MLNQEQINHYRQHGLLIMKQFIASEEVEMLRKEVNRMITYAPVRRGANCDVYDEPVEHPGDFAFTDLKPKGKQVLNRISAPLARSEVMRRAFGNPKLLSAVESLYGPDFTPSAEAIVIKLPGNGAPFAWHQDGNFKTGVQPERGVNFGIYLYASSQENGCLYVIPKSHTWGQVDIQRMIDEHGERLPQAIPVCAKPGDVIVHSRNLIHGSFANASPNLRVTVYFGYHISKTVEGVFEQEHIKTRMRAIPLAVRLRVESGLFPNEEPYLYAPFQSTLDLPPAEQQDLLRTPPLHL